MSELTYGRLDNELRSLGFSAYVVDEKARVYTEEKTGALIALPLFPDDREVLPRHVLAVRSTLQAYGLSDLPAFDTEHQRAS